MIGAQKIETLMVMLDNIVHPLYSNQNSNKPTDVQGHTDSPSLRVPNLNIVKYMPNKEQKLWSINLITRSSECPSAVLCM